MLCVIAKLNDSAADTLVKLQRAAASHVSEMKPLYGHITIASYVGDDESGFVRSCKQLLKGFSAFEVVYDKVEVLDETSVIVVTPVKSEPLSSLHQRIAELFYDSLDRWTKDYTWYPHTTLIFDTQSDLHDICNKMAASFAPFKAEVRTIEFSRVCENTYEIIDRIELPSG